MSTMPEADTTVGRIVRSYEAREDKKPRTHLGASMLGKECERELWYSFRWAFFPRYEGRILRLFNRGKREEEVFASDLRAAGVTVHEVDQQTGKQFQFSDLGGHCGGSMDGAAVGLAEAPKTWHVLEFKTHSNKSFTSLKKDGVAKAHPEHVAQMQLYMGWSGMTRAYYLAVNKDTDELYGERVEFDRATFDKLRERARRIIFDTEAPIRISDDKEFFKCRFCSFNKVCHGESFPKMTCRSCCHATAKENGTWHCSRHDKTLTADEQLAACGEHLYLPPMMPVEPNNAGESWVEYKFGDGVFFNIEDGNETAPNEGPIMKSSELEKLTVEQLRVVLAAKREFNGSVSHVA